MNDAEQRRRELRSEMMARRDRAFAAAPSWRTRTRRRSLVGVVLALAVASVVCLHLVADPFLVTALLFVVACVPLVGLRLLTRGVAESADTQLDERDRGLRDRAVRVSFLLVMGAVAAVAVYVAITQHHADLGSRVTNLLAVLAWTGAFAPTLVLAWTLPDDDPADLA